MPQRQAIKKAPRSHEMLYKKIIPAGKGKPIVHSDNYRKRGLPEISMVSVKEVQSGY
jgi:hypothetical protein